MKIKLNVFFTLLFLVLFSCEDDDRSPSLVPLTEASIIYERSGVLYTMNADGSDTTKFIHANVNLSLDPDGTSPLSPNKTGLLAVSQGDLWLYAQDKMNGVLLARNTRNASWSSDGSKVLFFQETTNNGEGKLYYYDLELALKTEIPVPTVYYARPQWLNDYVVYAISYSSQGRTFLGTINIVGGTVHEVELDISDVSAFRISNNREKMVLEGRDQNGVWGVYTANSDGSGLRLLAEMDTRRIYDWSPDDSKVLVASNSNGPDAWNVFSIDVNTGERINLSGMTSPQDKAWHPSWSPDGTQIVYSQRDATRLRGYDLYKVNADGTGRTNLTNYDPPMSGHFNAVWVNE